MYIKVRYCWLWAVKVVHWLNKICQSSLPQSIWNLKKISPYKINYLWELKLWERMPNVTTIPINLWEVNIHISLFYYRTLQFLLCSIKLSISVCSFISLPMKLNMDYVFHWHLNRYMYITKTYSFLFFVLRWLKLLQQLVLIYFQ